MSQTGLPKGVEISHYNHVAHAKGFLYMTGLDEQYEEKRRRASALCFLPMYHAYSESIFVVIHAYERVPVYIMPTFDFGKMLSHVEAFRITRLF